MHQFRWLGPLNNRLVPRQKSHNSICLRKEKRALEGGACSLSQALGLVANSLAVEKRSSARPAERVEERLRETFFERREFFRTKNRGTNDHANERV